MSWTAGELHYEKLESSFQRSRGRVADSCHLPLSPTHPNFKSQPTASTQTTLCQRYTKRSDKGIIESCFSTGLSSTRVTATITVSGTYLNSCYWSALNRDPSTSTQYTSFRTTLSRVQSFASVAILTRNIVGLAKLFRLYIGEALRFSVQCHISSRYISISRAGECRKYQKAVVKEPRSTPLELGNWFDEPFHWKITLGKAQAGSTEV